LSTPQFISATARARDPVFPVCLARRAPGRRRAHRAAVAAESIRSVQALEGVSDPRRARGRRHGLRAILLLALQAAMSGATTWGAIAQWASTAPQAVAVCA